MNVNNDSNIPENNNSQVKFVDLEMLQYDSKVLMFLRKKLDTFAVGCLIKVKNQHTKDGLNKTKLEDYVVHRKRYDTAFVILEAQGFVEKRSEGISKPYFLTVRGFQLLHLLVAEREKAKLIEG